MKPRPPRFHPSDPRRARDAQDALGVVVRDAVLQAVAAGWREAEAAIAVADAADDYILFLSERPRRNPSAANSNG
jgi:hypothetical protein